MNSVDISAPSDFKHVFHYPNPAMSCDEEGAGAKETVEVLATPHDTPQSHKQIYHKVAISTIPLVE